MIINWIKYKTNSYCYDSFLKLFSIVIDHKYLSKSIESHFKLINITNILLKDPYKIWLKSSIIFNSKK